MSKTLIFDLESDNLFYDITKVHCIRAYHLEDKKMLRYDKDNEPFFKGIQELNEGILVGHNIINFDIPALMKLFPKFKWKNRQVFDTMLMSKLVCADIVITDIRLMKEGILPPKLYGSHSLKAWGYRLGYHKGTFATDSEEEDVWAEYSKEMADYCEQDVKVTTKLYFHLLKRIQENEVPQSAIDIEHKFAMLMARQEHYGVLFDLEKAKKLEETLRKEQISLLDALQSQFKPKWFTDGKVREAKRSSRRKIVHPITGRPDWQTTNYVEGAQYQEIKYTEFNPASGSHIIRWLTEDYGWIPSEFTDAGTPKTDADTLEKLDIEGIETLKRYLMVNKRLTQLVDGKQSLMNNVRSDSRIHGHVDSLGAVTRRCTHNSPNLAQVPANTIEYGSDFRSLFKAPEGRIIIGADASGLELRVLAHYLYIYDKGEYGEVVLNGDVHWKNTQDTGLIEEGTKRDKHNVTHEKQRSLAKTFIYAWLYGAGDVKIGRIVKPNATEEEQKKIGKALKTKFMKSNPTLAKLISTIKDRAKARGFVYDLDGNKLYSRSNHSSPNLLFQSCGAIIMKYWAVRVDEKLQLLGLKNSFDMYHSGSGITNCDYEFILNVHDEAQTEAKKELEETIMTIKTETFNEIGKSLNINIKIDGEAKSGLNWSDTH